MNSGSLRIKVAFSSLLYRNSAQSFDLLNQVAWVKSTKIMGTQLSQGLLEPKLIAGVVIHLNG